MEKLSQPERCQREITMGSEDTGRIFNALISHKEKMQCEHERKGDLQSVHKIQAEASMCSKETEISGNAFTRDRERLQYVRKRQGRFTLFTWERRKLWCEHEPGKIYIVFTQDRLERKYVHKRQEWAATFYKNAVSLWLLVSHEINSHTNLHSGKHLVFFIC